MDVDGMNYLDYLNGHIFLNSKYETLLFFHEA